MNRALAVSLAVLMVTSALTAAAAPAGAAAGSADSEVESYAGTHVAFDVDGDAITGYAVGGEEVFTEVSVQSQSEADIGLGIGLGAIVDLNGSGLSLNAESETNARVESESGAVLSAHDTERGHLIVQAGGEDQFVEAELAAGTSAETDGDAVVVHNGDHEGAFLVVGDGEVTVNDDGNVAADLEGDATLVFRSYDDGDRDDDAKEEETMIAEGIATAEVYVEQRADGIVSEAVTFGEETSAEVRAEADQRVEFTVERTVGEGTIVLTTVSEAAVGSAEDIEVTVDGEAAVEATSRSDLEAAAAGEEPRYMVASHSEAEGETSVYVAIDHFSERTVAIEGDTDGGDEGGEGDGSDDFAGADGLPGFGFGAALVGLLVAATARIRR